MKREEQIRNKALELYPDQFYSSIAQRSGAENVDNSDKREIFIKACEWADAHPDLYSVTRKAIEMERKRLIDKAIEFFYSTSGYNSTEELIKDFVKFVEG